MVESFHAQGTVAGVFSHTPAGVILHGSRSGRPQSVEAELRGTANYAASGIELGWNATIGDDQVAVHMSAAHWGWNARAASSRYLAVELAQPTVYDRITDGQVRAFCWWLREYALARWPALPLVFPTHAEVEAWGQTGVLDGKTDCYPNGDPRTEDLRARIMAELKGAGGDELTEEQRATLAWADAIAGELPKWAELLEGAASVPDWDAVLRVAADIRRNAGE